MTLYLAPGDSCRSVIDVIESLASPIEGIIGQDAEVGKKIMAAVCGSDADLEKFVSNGNSLS